MPSEAERLGKITVGTTPTVGTEIRVYAVGLLDTSANGLFAVASRVGPLMIVAVLASLYPVATLVLAQQLHHERLSKVQTAGVVLALIGVCAVVGGR